MKLDAGFRALLEFFVLLLFRVACCHELENVLQEICQDQIRCHRVFCAGLIDFLATIVPTLDSSPSHKGFIRKNLIENTTRCHLGGIRWVVRFHRTHQQRLCHFKIHRHQDFQEFAHARSQARQDSSQGQTRRNTSQAGRMGKMKEHREHVVGGSILVFVLVRKPTNPVQDGKLIVHKPEVPPRAFADDHGLRNPPDHERGSFWHFGGCLYFWHQISRFLSEKQSRIELKVLLGQVQTDSYFVGFGFVAFQIAFFEISHRWQPFYGNVGPSFRVSPVQRYTVFCWHHQHRFPSIPVPIHGLEMVVPFFRCDKGVGIHHGEEIVLVSFLVVELGFRQWKEGDSECGGYRVVPKGVEKQGHSTRAKIAVSESIVVR
mmetsp:Transcript_7737/g.18960  ORF Transcript_7737/g.18960 Transcript_7737/m.18960 type:complete len:374 (-) Transcript_7737:801-1922(-)